MKEISKVLGFLTYWLYGKDEEKWSVETILGLDWLWIGKFFEFDFEAWIKKFDGWRWGKSRFGTWNEFDVSNGNEGWTFGTFEDSIWSFGFFRGWKKMGLMGVSIRVENPYPAKTNE